MGVTEKNSSVKEMARLAQKASRRMSLLSTEVKNDALLKMANHLNRDRLLLVSENQKDVEAAQSEGLSDALVDRLVLNDKRIDGMIECLKDTAALADPVGEMLATFKRPNGLIIEKIRTPIGVVGIIFESRPNVTSDCMGLCLKSGNAVILKGGKEARHSNQAIFNILREALTDTEIPVDSVQLIGSTDRNAVRELLSLDKFVDVIIPRGGEGLIEFVVEHSRIPVIKHYKGLCHLFVEQSADLNMAWDICLNAKVQRPGVCNAIETLLVDKSIAAKFLPVMVERFRAHNVDVRGCEQTRATVDFEIGLAKEEDWQTEYLDLIISIRVVDSVQEAMDHINTYGSHHSDGIITQDRAIADQFLKGVDSSTVYHNASTRFTDGYEFGFGAEVGISTDKLHARGPMALTELTTYKYLVHGQGQIRS